MKVTDVKITIAPNESRLKAYVSITLDDCFVIHDLKMIRNPDSNKTFVAMPSKRRKLKNSFCDIAHPTNKETRSMIEEAVFKKYKEMLEQFKKEEKNFNTNDNNDL